MTTPRDYKGTFCCILLTLAGAAAVALFGYVLFTCLGLQYIQPRAAIQSLAEIFRHK